MMAMLLAVLLVAQGPISLVTELPVSVVSPPPVVAAVAAPLVEVSLKVDAAAPERFEVARLARGTPHHGWYLADVVRGAGTHLVVRAPAGVETLLVVRSGRRTGYLLDGPFRWPAQPSTFTVPADWRRTVRGRSAGGHRGSVVWLPASEERVREGWPLCGWTDVSSWECVGVPLGTPGVVIATEGMAVGFAVAPGVMTRPGIEEVQPERAAWGKLVVADRLRLTGSAAVAAIHGSARRLEVPRSRPQALRVESTTELRVHVRPVGPDAFWISASEPIAGAWLEIGGAGLAPLRVPIEDIAGTPVELPLRVSLETGLEVRGRVTAGPDTPAAGAAVALFRLLPAEPERGRDMRRLLVGETSASDDGTFRFEDLAMERYEIVAMHHGLGRGERQFDPDGQEIDVPLRRPAQAVGRVTREGVPAEGVRVAVVPDLAQFAAAADMTALRGGETTTDADGRFAVALSAAGKGEIRIGDERTGVRRIPFASADTLPHVLELGTIELGGLPKFTLVFEGSDGCDLLLVGPVGRAGMTTVRATRTGPAMFQLSLPEPGRWHVSAVCGRRERAVVPPAIDLSPSAHDRTLRISWPAR